MPTEKDATRDLFITGLRNAHAVEKQALVIMSPQVARIEQVRVASKFIRVLCPWAAESRCSPSGFIGG